MLPPACLGQIDLKSANGSAGSEYASVQPGQHEIWIINQFSAFHDDPAGGLTIKYNYYDGASNFIFGESGALAASAFTYLYEDCPGLPQEIVCTYDHYLRLQAVGIAAGKKVYWKATVTIFRGVPIGYGF